MLDLFYECKQDFPLPDLESKLSVLLVDRKPAVIVSYSAEGSALKGHVIDTVHVWDDFACAFSCLHTKNCFSFNFKESSRVCELNHSNKMTSPKDLSIDLDSNYYELVFS